MRVLRSEFELETIVRRINEDEIDLQPDFQRGDIWDTRRRQRLIDSLLRSWYIPAVHLVRQPNDETEVVLDGQQRLVAIRDFFRDKFPVDGSTTPYDDEIARLGGLRFSELPEWAQRRLRRFPLAAVTLYEYEPEEPNELFFRLNQSYNLTPSEKRNALHGRARNQIKEATSNLTEVGLLQKETIGFSNGRLAHDDIVARSCVALETANLKLHINNNVVETFYRESTFTPEVIETVEKAGRHLYQQCLHSGLRQRFNKATLFTWLIFCAWVPKSTGLSLPAELLHKFEQHRRSIKANEVPRELPPRLVGPVSMYDDRASYRVTDVSSVLSRDCVLYLYLQELYGAPPRFGSDILLSQLTSKTQTETQQHILEFVSQSDWGMLPEVGIE